MGASNNYRKKVKKVPQSVHDYQAIEASQKFRELMSKKKRFLIPSTILFLGLYILFPLIISYSDVLNNSFMGDISWSWIYALGLFVMTWVLVTIYMRKAAQFDRMAEDALKEFNYKEEEKL